MGQRDFHTEDYSRGFHQAEETSFNVMIHTRPNLMKNVGCCYGNSIRWNFSLLASLWHYSLKRTSWKGTLQWGQRKALEMTLPIFSSTEDSVIASWSHTSLLRGQDAKMLSWDFFETLKSLSLWSDLEIIRMITKFSLWRMLGWAKKTMKTMSLQKIRICFVVFSCLIFKHKYAPLKFHLNLSTDRKMNTKFEYLF